MKVFYGKYRGVVTNNLDPEQLGRIQAKVPDVLGAATTGWALPCAPYGGDAVGLFLIPPINASVWIEFEGGKPDFPIWSGCFWGVGGAPASPASAQKKVLKTEYASITLDDTPGAGSLTLETSTGQRIKLAATGIEIDNGQGATIRLIGPSVSINGNALEVV